MRRRTWAGLRDSPACRRPPSRARRASPRVAGERGLLGVALRHRLHRQPRRTDRQGVIGALDQTEAGQLLEGVASTPSCRAASSAGVASGCCSRSSEQGLGRGRETQRPERFHGSSPRCTDRRRQVAAMPVSDTADSRSGCYRLPILMPRGTPLSRRGVPDEKASGLAGSSPPLPWPFGLAAPAPAASGRPRLLPQSERRSPQRRTVTRASAADRRQSAGHAGARGRGQGPAGATGQPGAGRRTGGHRPDPVRVLRGHSAGGRSQSHRTCPVGRSSSGWRSCMCCCSRWRWSTRRTCPSPLRTRTASGATSRMRSIARLRDLRSVLGHPVR